MDFLDVLDVFFIFSSHDGDEKKRKRSNGNFFVFKILLLLCVVAWCVYEILQVVELTEPLLFISVASACGLVVTIVVMVVVWKLDWIEYITPLNFLWYLLPIVLISISMASFINRYYAKESVIEVVVSTHSDRDSFLLKSTVGQEFNLVILKSDYPDLKSGEWIQLKHSKGLFGFDRIEKIATDFKNRGD